MWTFGILSYRLIPGYFDTCCADDQGLSKVALSVVYRVEWK